MENQEIRKIYGEIGRIVYDFRLKNDLQVKELANILGYEPSVVSKVENGSFVSPKFVDLFILKTDPDKVVVAKLQLLKASLTKVKKEDKTPVPIPAALNDRQGIRVQGKIWKIWLLIGIIVVLLITAFALWSAYRPRKILGPVDFQRACQKQFLEWPDAKTRLKNSRDVYTWECTIILGGKPFPIGGDIDTYEACREQYNSPLAGSAFKDSNDAYSWYCFMP